MTNKEWFPNAKFGLMVHFGLYSLLGGEWKGNRMDYIGEWIQSRYEIPAAEYGKLAKAFNPVYFDANEWVKIAEDAGMRYMVVTAKHHEGFALFRSAWDDFNAYSGTPFHRDIIGELSEACYKRNMKFGLYYSQELDWHEPNGGGYLAGHSNFGMSWTNDWDFPDNAHKDYTECFEGKIKTQMKELLTQYGDLCLVWCDTPGVITESQSRELYDMIKKYQPDCLVNSRIGNGLGDYCSTADNDVHFETDGERGLYECPATLNDTWGYKSFDNHWKTPEEVVSLRDRLNKKGINYLLNVGPDGLGRFPAPAIDILQKVGNM